ncbi:MAG: response regulator [Armatimonadota bacterium]|jgi:DNA-binding response OmpR family regulator
MTQLETQGRIILVVDDEPTILMMARYVLEPAGYVVLGAYSGKEGLEVFSERHAELDLVVLDFMLPDIAGDEVMRRMVEIDDTVPFVAASGCSEYEVAKDMRDGAVCFLRKPFDLKAFPAQITAAIGEAAPRRAHCPPAKACAASAESET